MRPNLNTFHNMFRQYPCLPVLGMAWLLVSACETRKPLEPGLDGQQPILVMLAKTGSLPANRDTSTEVSAYLLNADRGALPDKEIFFSAELGVIGASAFTDPENPATVTYISPRLGGLTRAVQDRIVATFVYDGGDKRVNDTLFINLIPEQQGNADSVGSLELVAPQPSVQVKAAGAQDQALILARVQDVFKRKMPDGTPVEFAIVSGPGGGENLNNSGSVDTALTQDGVAKVIFNSGTELGLVEIRATSGNRSVRQALLTITSGPPRHISIRLKAGEAEAQGARWKVPVYASLTDAHFNPVKDSISVLFSLLTDDSSQIAIMGSAVTGNKSCEECTSEPGTAVSSIAYVSDKTFDTVDVAVETLTAEGKIRVVQQVVLPVVEPEVSAHYFGNVLRATGIFNPDSGKVIGRLKDGLGNPVEGGKLCANANAGTFLDSTCQFTDAKGEVEYEIKVTRSDWIDENTMERTIRVQIFESTSGENAAIEVPVLFQ